MYVVSFIVGCYDGVYMKTKNLKFVPFIKEKHLDIVTDAFQTIIAPSYGDQSVAINKIISSSDRSCEILLLDDIPVGFLVYKKLLQEEFGLSKAFELKTVLILNKYKGNGLGKYLFRYAENIAKTHHAQYIYGTVSPNLENVENCMKGEGWRILKHATSTDHHVDVSVMIKDLTSDSSDLGKLLAFFHLCENLKTEKRHGKTSDGEYDRVASHAWRLAIIVMFIVPHLNDKTIDLLKCLKLALIHDLAEAITGDQAYFVHMFNTQAKELKEKKENQAILEICNQLPIVNETELKSLWADYELQDSYESKIVKAIDKIEAQMQHNEADISVWNDYDKAHYNSYLDKFCDFDVLLKQLRQIIQLESKEKLGRGG